MYTLGYVIKRIYLFYLNLKKEFNNYQKGR